MALFFARPKSIPKVLRFFLYNLSAITTVVPHAVVAIGPAIGALIFTFMLYIDEGHSESA